MGFFSNDDDDDDENGLVLDDAEVFQYMLDDVLDNIHDLDEITLDADMLQSISERGKKNEM